MKARRPPFSFDGAQAFWVPEMPAYGHNLNGGSLTLPYLEPYLIKVLNQARDRLQDSRPDLVRDIDVFSRQEANHFRAHAAYNRVLRRQYEGIEEFEAEIRTDFESFLEERSLEWNLAYCDGFESIGLISGELFLGPMAGVLETADPQVRSLWEWHLAEEIEHRNVCYDVLKALFPGWRTRVSGFRFASRHLQSFGNRVMRHLLAQDHAAGRLSKDRRSRLRRRRVAARAAAFALPRNLWVLAPGYGPARRVEGPSVEAALARYEV